jgi:hypothetical protein
MKEALDKGASFELPQLDRWNNTLKLQCVKSNIPTLRYGRFSGFCQGKNRQVPLHLDFSGYCEYW